MVTASPSLNQFIFDLYSFFLGSSLMWHLTRDKHEALFLMGKKEERVYRVGTLTLSQVTQLPIGFTKDYWEAPTTAEKQTRDLDPGTSRRARCLTDPGSSRRHTRVTNVSVWKSVSIYLNFKFWVSMLLTALNWRFDWSLPPCVYVRLKGVFIKPSTR